MRRSAFTRPSIARALNFPSTARRTFVFTSHAFYSTPATDSPPTTTLDAPPTIQSQSSQIKSSLPPFRFETGISLFAKRAPRPFPPPFLSPPSGSFSDPLSTHNRSRDRRAFVNGELIRGYTNGDDAVCVGDNCVLVGDGVGAWSTRPGGHAGLWSRLILHFWASEIESHMEKAWEGGIGEEYTPSPVEYLQKAYELTKEATSEPNKWQGTTTATGAQLHFRKKENEAEKIPVLYVTNLGDSQVLVLRPATGEVLFKTSEQWHWFDCPRQLGTNSPDTPADNAVVDEVEIRENDIVLAMSDGVIDNLWEHEIVEKVVESIKKWEEGLEMGSERMGGRDKEERRNGVGGMAFVAEELMNAARVIAQDPFAESPFMEHAVEEGLAMEGGKLDDISVVVALCRKNPG